MSFFVIKLDDTKSRGTSVFCILPMVITSSFFYYKGNYIDWKISINNTEETIASLRGETGIKPSDLTFVPNIYTGEDEVYLRAYHGEEILLSIPMIIAQGSEQVIKPSGMALELTAYNKMFINPSPLPEPINKSCVLKYGDINVETAFITKNVITKNLVLVNFFPFSKLIFLTKKKYIKTESIAKI